jgi:outer membrane protein OmpA-like peptidoglycan-associated protein
VVLRRAHALAPVTVGVLSLLSAAALGDPISLRLDQAAPVGKLPAIVITVNEPVGQVNVRVTREDGAVTTAKFTGKPGLERKIPLPQPTGKHSFKGELTIRKPGHETATMPLDFETEVFLPARIGIHPTKAVDLSQRRLNFTLNRPCNKAELTVTDDTGAKAFQKQFDFAPVEAGVSITLEWPPLENRVLRLTLRAHGTDSTFDTVDLTPWEVDIPHEEVNFETGKFSLLPTETQKLDASVALIAAGIEKYGHLAPLRLYVVGHTDSVGDGGANQTLSLRRAQSIATYFRKKGLRLPIFFDGFGEYAQAVQTADEVDEPKNRRAEYILTIQTPQSKSSTYAPKWNRL